MCSRSQVGLTRRWVSKYSYVILSTVTVRSLNIMKKRSKIRKDYFQKLLTFFQIKLQKGVNTTKP